MSLKNCTSCNELKPLPDYPSDKNSADGAKSSCKICVNKKQNAFRRTKNGILSRIYSNQVSNSSNRKMLPPNYTLNELKQLALSMPLFHSLFDNWVKSNYDKWLSPSFDRKNDYIPYTFDNIQLTTWRENSEKAHNDKVNGINNKNNKKVIQMTVDGAVVSEYHSVSEAHRITGLSQGSISSCCRHEYGRKSIGGFKWEYAK